MKKILSLLSTITMLASTSATVISCGNKKDDYSKPKEDSIESLIKQFKEEVNEIVNNHIKEKSKNFFIVDEQEKNSLKFFKRTKFSSFMGELKNKKADDSIRQDIIDDFYSILEVNELKSKIDNLQNLEKYSVILGDVNSVFKEIVVSSNENIDLSTKYSASSINDVVWFGTTKFNYSISVNFKNKLGQIEEYKISDIPAIATVTDNVDIGKNIQNMYSKVNEQFIKDEVSRIYSNQLTLNSKTYLENTDSEILSYLNSQSGIDKFVSFIKTNFDLNLELTKNNSFNNVYTYQTYRSSGFKYDEAKGNEFIEAFFRNSSNESHSSYLNETQAISDSQYKTAVKNKLNSISNNLDQTSEVTDLINSSLKMLQINLTNLAYKIDEDIYVEIPDLNLDFGYFKNNSITSRDQLESDIMNNINVARDAFNQVFQTTYTPNINYKPVLFYFKSNSKVFKAWDDSGIFGTKSNINEYTNLTKQSLIDYRNQLLNSSKQSNFKFNVSWSADDSGDMPYVVKYLNNTNKREIALSKDGSYSKKFRLSINLEFDYFKIEVNYNQFAAGERIISTSNTE